MGGMFVLVVGFWFLVLEAGSVQILFLTNDLGGNLINLFKNLFKVVPLVSILV